MSHQFLVSSCVLVCLKFFVDSYFSFNLFIDNYHLYQQAKDLLDALVLVVDQAVSVATIIHLGDVIVQDVGVCTVHDHVSDLLFDIISISNTKKILAINKTKTSVGRYILYA